MAEQTTVKSAIKETEAKPAYTPSAADSTALQVFAKALVKARTVMNRSYNQFNGRTLYQSIDDWTKRWNGFIPQANELLDASQSRIFLNFTRNAIISWLSKVAQNLPKVDVVAINKKTNVENKKFAEILEDLNTYSLREENGEARFFESCLEVTVKGTVIKYEGYKRAEQKVRVADGFDWETGRSKWKNESRVVFDNCFQEVVPLEDFYIANPYESDVQKQPFVIWRKTTSLTEAEREFGHYSNWKYVRGGTYAFGQEPTTFYRNRVQTEIEQDQVEVYRYYDKYENEHFVIVGGVMIYNGPIPFRDGRIPFAKGIVEPFENAFFWGASFCQKIMGEQDLINTVFNMMVDKTMASLLPLVLSSDADDLAEDDTLELNKIRKVGDINKWRFEQLPGVTGGEESIIQMALNFVRENSGIAGGDVSFTPRGGKTTVRQTLLKQQEMMQKIGFSVSLMEDFEKDRTELRIAHILQFYSIPKVEKITGESGADVQKLVYRDVKLSGVRLKSGQTGERIIKLVGDEHKSQNDRLQIANDLSVTEAMGEQNGMPTEALALSVDTFYDWDYKVHIIKNSSYEKNQALDQAVRHEYADWRLSIAQVVPVDGEELVKWVDEAYDIEHERFMPKAPPQAAAAAQGAPMANARVAAGAVPGPAAANTPSKVAMPAMM